MSVSSAYGSSPCRWGTNRRQAKPTGCPSISPRKVVNTLWQASMRAATCSGVAPMPSNTLSIRANSLASSGVTWRTVIVPIELAPQQNLDAKAVPRRGVRSATDEDEDETAGDDERRVEATGDRAQCL